MATIKLRRDQASDWVAVNPVLANGEPGYEDDTGKFKIGDGVARWLDLEYFFPGPNATAFGDLALTALQSVQDHINSLTPHSVYDDGPSLFLLYQNAKV